MGTPDLTLQECCERWGVSSRNSVKARAAALGVELRRESSTRTVWPREDVPLGDELHDHLQTGGTLRDFPGALPPTGGGAVANVAKKSAVTASAGGSDAMLMAVLQLMQQQQAPQQPAALARARALAAAADEALPLTALELAELLGLDADEVLKLKDKQVIYGFRLLKFGQKPKEGLPDRRAFILERVVQKSTGLVDLSDGVTAVNALPPVTTELKRSPGFAIPDDAVAATAVVMSRVTLPPVRSSLPSAHWYH